MTMRPAMRLEGLTLEGGWKVIKRIDPASTDTGGHFSVAYKVEDVNGKGAFLKALDFSRALQSSDPARELQAMLEAYNFERDLLKKCKDHRLSKIIMPLADGKVEVPGEVTDLRFVMYLIFELADGNVRQFYNLSQNIDLAWCLRSLHNTAVALQQLHSRSVAHQDLKPSNILVFAQEREFKVSDLGRASDQFTPCDNDKRPVAGDMGYAPLELFYGYSVTNEFYRRYGVDMYHLGSLIFFYFVDISATQAIKVKLCGHAGPPLTNNNFKNDLPYIRKAFSEAVKELEGNIRPKAGKLTDEIISMVTELCEPDPEKRGHPKNRNTNPYGLERYISGLDVLASKAEYDLK